MGVSEYVRAAAIDLLDEQRLAEDPEAVKKRVLAAAAVETTLAVVVLTAAGYALFIDGGGVSMTVGNLVFGTLLALDLGADVVFMIQYRIADAAARQTADQ